jgi:tetratricopeptide (TPR) repeat protein
MLQVRISHLDTETRRILRGASLFGTTFWNRGIHALSGEQGSIGELDQRLKLLVNAELIEQSPESRFPNQHEYIFRHKLMRDAAYSLLTEQDRSLGHRLAASFLERNGEKDAMILGEHLRFGGAREAAVPYYIRAAEQSYEGHDWQGILDRTAQGQACGAQGEALGRLRVMQFLALYWRTEWSLAFPIGLEALNLLQKGSFWWCTAMSSLFTIAGNINQTEKMQELVSLFASAEPAPDAGRPYIAAGSILVVMFSLLGLREQALLFLEAMQRAGSGLLEQDITARGAFKTGYGCYTRLLSPDPWLAYKLAKESGQAYQQVDDLHSKMPQQNLLGTTEAELGNYAEAEVIHRRSLTLAEKLNETGHLAFGKVYLASVLIDQADRTKWEEAKHLVNEVVRLDMSPSVTGFAHSVLSQILSNQGQYEAAEEHARKAVGMLAMMRTYRIAAIVNLVRSLLAQGRVSEARTHAEEGVQLVTALGGSGYNEVSMRLALAESRYAVGDLPAAREALASTVDQLLIRVEKIPDPAQRQRFLFEVRDNARTCELARTWLGRTVV